MTDMEKVISDVISAFDEWEYNMRCPGEDWSDEHKSRDMVIALLKAQEPVEPTIGRCEEYDGHDSWWYQCGKCQKPIDYNDKYCRNCGQAVKWE